MILTAQRTNARCKEAMCTVAFVVLSLWINVPALEYEYFLWAALPSTKPEITDNIISYVLDLQFKSLPNYFWIYYSEPTKSMVVDIYGGHIEPVHFQLAQTTPFQEVSIENLSTNMTLSKKQSNIKILLDSRWSYTAEKTNGNKIRITIWKPAIIQEKVIQEKKSRYIIAYVAASAAVIWAVFSVVLAINTNL
jgi:hypothetical protein